MLFVFDLDGTLADITHRRHLVSGKNGQKKDWRSFYRSCVSDLPMPHIIATLVALYDANHKIEIWSGRSDEVLFETFDWLTDNVLARIENPRYSFSGESYIADIFVRMRKAVDHRPDEKLKQEWLDESIAQGKKITAAFDDRNRIVEMWRRNGIPCFQVAPGDF